MNGFLATSQTELLNISCHSRGEGGRGKSHDYLPQEREGEEGLSLQVEPEWRNEL